MNAFVMKAIAQVTSVQFHLRSSDYDISLSLSEKYSGKNVVPEMVLLY